MRPGKLMAGLVASCPDEKTALRRFVSEFDVSPERAALCLATTRETLRAEASLGARDVCLYVGIPFCPTRCAYCSFVSQSVEKSMKLMAPFFEALLQELRAVAGQVRRLGLRVISIYMGGGTPTTLTAPMLDRLCAALGCARFKAEMLRLIPRFIKACAFNARNLVVLFFPVIPGPAAEMHALAAKVFKHRRLI